MKAREHWFTDPKPPAPAAETRTPHRHEEGTTWPSDHRRPFASELNRRRGAAGAAQGRRRVKKSTDDALTDADKEAPARVPAHRHGTGRRRRAQEDHAGRKRPPRSSRPTPAARRAPSRSRCARSAPSSSVDDDGRGRTEPMPPATRPNCAAIEAEAGPPRGRRRQAGRAAGKRSSPEAPARQGCAPAAGARNRRAPARPAERKKPAAEPPPRRPQPAARPQPLQAEAAKAAAPAARAAAQPGRCRPSRAAAAGRNCAWSGPPTLRRGEAASADLAKTATRPAEDERPGHPAR